MTTDRALRLKKQAFITAYQQCATITGAAAAVGVHRSQHYSWLDKDPWYVDQFEHAEQSVVDMLESEAVRRAIAGSDTLLIFLLKGLRPDRYQQRTSVEVKQHTDAGQLVEQARAKVLQYLPGGAARGA